MNKFIQNREFQILLHNNLNLHSYNGLDTLRMILKYSNEDFDFGPLMSETEQLLFCDKQLNDFNVHQFTTRFDEIHIVMSAFLIVCYKNELSDYVNDLNEFLTSCEIQLDRE